MNTITTCYKCNDRFPGCHDHCDKYLKAKEDFKKTKHKINEARSMDSAIRRLKSNLNSGKR